MTDSEAMRQIQEWALREMQTRELLEDEGKRVKAAFQGVGEFRAQWVNGVTFEVRVFPDGFRVVARGYNGNPPIEGGEHWAPYDYDAPLPPTLGDAVEGIRAGVERGLRAREELARCYAAARASIQ